MRGHRSSSDRRSLSRPRFGTIVVLVALVLIVGQSLGLVAAGASGTSRDRTRSGSFSSDTTKVGAQAVPTPPIPGGSWGSARSFEEPEPEYTGTETTTSSSTTTPPPAPDLNISKTGPQTIGIGDTITYVVTVSNDGNGSTGGDVIVTDTLDNGLLTVDTDDERCDVNGQTVTCNVGALDPEDSPGSITITAIVTADACPSFDNTASAFIQYEGQGEGEGTQSNTVHTVVADCITLEKEGPSSVGQGGTITYTITIENHTNSDAFGVVVTDNLDNSLTNVSASFEENEEEIGCSVGTQSDPNDVTCRIGTLSEQETETITITATAPTGSCPTITNQASATFNNDLDLIDGVAALILGISQQQPPTIFSNTVTTTITGCSQPSPIGIQVVKGGPSVAHVGDTITYTFAVSATTSTVFTNVTVTDPICSAAPTLVSKTGGDQDDILETGETWTYSCTHVVSAADPDPLPNTATVTGTAPDGRQASAQGSHVVDIIHPAIQIVKSAKPTSIGPGETVTYTYEVTNTGDVALSGVKVTDSKLGGVCSIAQLAVGQSVTCTATFTTPQLGGPIDNVGRVKGRDPTGLTVRDSDTASVDVVLGTTVTPPGATGGIAFTGAAGVVPLAGLALLLLLGGTGILFLTRRRGDRPGA